MKKSLLLFSLILMGATSAATVNFTIFVDQFDPAYTASTANVGTVTYDESKLTGVGDEELTVADGATVSFRFDGQWYTEASDTDYPVFPAFYFTDGEFEGLGFEAQITSPAATAGSYIAFNGKEVDYSFDGSGEFSAHIEVPVTPVPEPSGTIILALGVLLSCGIRRRSLK